MNDGAIFRGDCCIRQYKSAENEVFRSYQLNSPIQPTIRRKGKIMSPDGFISQNNLLPPKCNRGPPTLGYLTRARFPVLLPPSSFPPTLPLPFFKKTLDPDKLQRINNKIYWSHFCEQIKGENEDVLNKIKVINILIEICHWKGLPKQLWLFGP